MSKSCARQTCQRMGPSARSALLRHRCFSRPLERVVTDIAANLPFAKAMDKRVAHHGTRRVQVPSRSPAKSKNGLANTAAMSAFYHAGEYLAAKRVIGVDKAAAGARLDTPETRLQFTSCAIEVILSGSVSGTRNRGGLPGHDTAWSPALAPTS